MRFFKILAFLVYKLTILVCFSIDSLAQGIYFGGSGSNLYCSGYLQEVDIYDGGKSSISAFGCTPIQPRMYSGGSSGGDGFSCFKQELLLYFGGVENPMPCACHNTFLNSLPVELLSFELLYSPVEVQIKWTTAQEFNSSHFDIQRMQKNDQWVTVLSVNAIGFSQTIRNYLETDYNPQPGLNFYRIIQYDNDGEYESLGIRKIVVPESFSGMIVYPNPCFDDFLNVNLSYNYPAEVKLLDIRGKVIYHGTLTGNYNQIPITNYTPGLYWVLVSQGDKAVKLIIDH